MFGNFTLSNNSISKLEMVLENLGLMIVGEVSRFPRTKTKQPMLIDELNEKSPIPAEFKRITRNLPLYLENHKVFQITSLFNGEGKTTCASNIALVASQKGQKVLLIDGNVSNPQLQQVFELDNDLGFFNLYTSFDETTKLENTWSHIKSTKHDNLFVITAGKSEQVSYSELNLVNIDTVAKQFTNTDFDLIILDMQPEFSTYLQVPTLLVIDTKLRPQKLIKHLNQLDSKDTNIFGVLMNNADPKRYLDYKRYLEQE